MEKESLLYFNSLYVYLIKMCMYVRTYITILVCQILCLIIFIAYFDVTYT